MNKFVFVIVYYIRLNRATLGASTMEWFNLAGNGIQVLVS